jgi:hypothetical protein
MSGNKVPAAIAATTAIPFSAQLVLSAYWNTRYYRVRKLLLSPFYKLTKYGLVPPLASSSWSSLSLSLFFSCSLFRSNGEASAFISDGIVGGQGFTFLP